MARTIRDDPDFESGPRTDFAPPPSMSKEAMRQELTRAVVNTGGKSMEKPKRAMRTSAGLRDLLFDEIDELRAGDGDPSRAMAVANIAKQILNTARVELDFHRTMKEAQEAGTPIELGTLKLGTDPAPVAAVAKPATAR